MGVKPLTIINTNTPAVFQIAKAYYTKRNVT